MQSTSSIKIHVPTTYALPVITRAFWGKLISEIGELCSHDYKDQILEGLPSNAVRDKNDCGKEPSLFQPK